MKMDEIFESIKKKAGGGIFGFSLKSWFGKRKYPVKKGDLSDFLKISGVQNWAKVCNRDLIHPCYLIHPFGELPLFEVYHIPVVNYNLLDYL